jgi:hypothetical protein
MTTTRTYSSLDSGAPVITGQLGTVKDALKKILYGDGSGVAYGTGPSQKLAAGWSIAYESGNKIALKNSLAAGGTGCIVRIDDTGPGAGGAAEAFMRAYSAMSDVDTGSDPTPPTTATPSTGVVLRKSATLDSTARPWLVFADQLTFYVALFPALTTFTSASHATDNLAGAGDFASVVPGDNYRYFCGGRGTINNTSQGGDGLVMSANAAWASASTPGVTTAFYVGRGYAGAGASLPANVAVLECISAGMGLTNALANPAPGSNDEFWQGVAPIICETTIRGFLRGIYVPLCNMTNVAAGTQRSGVAGLPSGHLLTVVRSGSIVGGGLHGGVGIESALAW